jgi:transcriptional regulator with AAA-type ATPase domain
MTTEESQHEETMPMPPDGGNVLSEAALKSLRPYAQEVSYPSGTTIVRRGDPGSAFYLIVSGRAEVILGGGECRLPLARLGEGDSFGEMSLLTGVPVSADVATVTAATLMMIPAERFQDALGASAPLRNHVFTRLCDDLRRTSSQSWDLFQHTQALSSLIHVQDSDEPMIYDSTAMVRLQKRIDELTCQSFPILIAGEAGTGKFFTARKIPRAIARQGEPLIILDCEQIGENQADRILFGAQQVQEFTSRDSKADGSDLQVQGALHLADKGSIVIRHIDSLDISAQQTLCLYLDTLGRLEDLFPQVRVIATTSEDLAILAQAGRFHSQLAEQLTGNALDMPPLRKRKRDILPLAEFFLTSGQPQNDDSMCHFTKAAEHALLSGRYQHRNVAELREAVELASSFAEGDRVDAEHIFTGPKNQGHTIEYDLTRNRLVQWLIQGSSLHLVQGIMLTVFSAIIVLCLSAGTTLTGRVANTLVWAAWWPALLILFLFVGRLWCTVCPISTAGRVFRLPGCLKLTPPAWIKNHAGWITAFLFLIIMWAEHVFRMTQTPFATAILLMSLMLLAIFFCLVFQREMWCRYLCPLGSLAAGYSVCSTVQVHANPNVCASQCTSHECFKGSMTESGCPVYHHPLYARDAHLCKLCFTCMRSCPHQSARIYLRPPLHNLWRLGELGRDLVPFALVVFFLAIVMLSSHKLAWNATVGGFTILAGLSVILALVLYAGLAKLFANDKDPALAYRVAFGLLILAWGPFMAFHLGDIPELDAILIRAADDSVLSSIFNTLPISLLLVLQFGAIIFAAVCTAICFWHIRLRQANDNGKTSFWPWRFIVALSAFYLLVAIVLVLPGDTL